MNASQIIFERLAPLVDDKCYPLFIPETNPNKPPYIIYQIISTEPDNDLDGITGHEWANVQLDVYHHDYDECIELTHKVIAQLNEIKPSIYHGVQYLHDIPSGFYRSLIEYGFWQTMQ